MAAFMVYGLVLNPRLTRLVGGIYSVEALSDYLQLVYTAAKRLEKE